MSTIFQFNRMEVSGSLGDLGTLLPLAIGMVLVNGMNPVNVFLCIGLYYIFSGLYFRVTTPVEPMKVVAAYAIASGIAATQIQASGLLISGLLFLFAGTGLLTSLRSKIPLAVIRGVQLATGTLLILKGINLMTGESPLQMMQSVAEPYLGIQAIGPIPIGIVIGVSLSALTLYLLNNKVVPAALVVVFAGFAIGMLLRADGSSATPLPTFTLPEVLPYGLPSAEDFSFALLVLVLPQIPMTIGNAIIANADLSAKYFPETGKRVTPKALCFSMALANLGAFLLGGIPMCHGAGGLASRYRFGARTGGSNLIIGAVFLLLVFLFGPNSLTLLHLIPLSALGVLLVFAGVQLSLTLLDVKERKDLFVVVIMLSTTLATNLAAGFLFGIVLALALRSPKLTV